LSAQVEAAAQQVKAAEGMVQQLEHRRERARRAVKSRKDPYKQIIDVYVAIEEKLALEKRLEEVKQLAQSVRDAIRDLGTPLPPPSTWRAARCAPRRRWRRVCWLDFKLFALR
jgi:chromosome segregation ATPase